MQGREAWFSPIHGGFLEAESFRDVDIAVWLEEGEDPFRYAVEVAAKLEGELGIPLDLHVLNESPLPFKYQVLTKGLLLFSRDEGVRSRVVDETIRQYFDLKLLRKHSV